MNHHTTNQIKITRIPKDAVVRSRCSVSLRNRLARIASLKEADLSDVVRDALVAYVTQFEQRLAIT
jgi:hypothetical protein